MICRNFSFCRSYTNDRICAPCSINNERYGIDIRPSKSVCCLCGKQKANEMRFPTCGHWFCPQCVRRIIFGEDDENYLLNPVFYGCKPCTCHNPLRGLQCKCSEQLYQIKKWSQKNPCSFVMWKIAQEESIEIGSGEDTIIHSKKCPICKKFVELCE